MRLLLGSDAIIGKKQLSFLRSGTADQTFTGFVLEYGPDDMPVKGLQTSSLAIKVSGPVVQA